MKKKFSGRPSAFFTSDEYADLQKQRKRIEDERSHIELELQSYFDHFAHGASKTETAKPERVPLKLAQDLEGKKVGFRQIQMIDAYCLGRGNEMWAIIPDLLRIGHDIHPVDLVHWQPPHLDNVPEPLRSYREEQNKAFAKRLLNPHICSPGLRSKLLATHTHGVKKVSFKANPNDGCAIYWVMLQLYRPVGRDHRRELELSICKMHSKFNSGNPHPPLEDLTTKVREGMDIGARIRWDTSAVPLIDTLCTRDPMFTVRLSDHRNLPPDPDDSIVQFDELISDITDVVDILDKAGKDWTEKAAMAARQSKQSDDYRKLAKEVAQLKSALSANNPNPFSSKPSTKDKRTPAEGHCQVKGCGRKIDKWNPKNKWKLCSTCLLQVTKTGKPVTLNDGTQWGNRNTAMSVLGHMRKKGVQLPKALAKSLARKNAVRVAKGTKRDRSDSDPETNGEDGEEEGQARTVRFQDEEFTEGTEGLFRELKTKKQKLSKRTRT